MSVGSWRMDQRKMMTKMTGSLQPLRQLMGLWMTRRVIFGILVPLDLLVEGLLRYDHCRKQVDIHLGLQDTPLKKAILRTGTLRLRVNRIGIHISLPIQQRGKDQL